MRRRGLLVLAGLVLAMVVLAGGALELFWPRPPCPHPPCFTKDMADRIQPGTPEAEVVAILGRRAGDYASPNTRGVSSRSSAYRAEGIYDPDGSCTKAWFSDAGIIRVHFSPDRRVISREWEAVYTAVYTPRSEMSLAEQIQDWIRRLWP
jgi:hypothetical protein